ncbi:hypothetical protein LTR70_007445 [Exophiala xenobiotica]|uniref:Uncharacterized protein n=1 Tax=Lithohypha guttulata TaxID=1690604 RepID=A0ABR0K4U4_9EURO|nr:hypothetical protein LTR24_006985 [Lithohypha guttulata]KAK5313802.1 hypothetical protein LTR70_007445 [Exophiala xenobiotica]
MESSGEYGALVDHPESPCATEIISLTESADNNEPDSDTNSDSSLPSLRDVLRPRKRSITDGKDIEGGAQQKRSRRQSRHRRQTTAERRGSVEIAESPSRSDHTSGLHSLGVTTVMTGSQDGGSTMERTQQHKVHSGKGPSSSMSTGQLDPEGRTNGDSHGEYRESQLPTTNAVELLVNLSGGSFLGVYGQRETCQGREYCCLLGAWLRPEDGVPHDQIQEYDRELVQRSRRQSLRKRKRESDHDGTDTQVLQKVRQWRADL